MARAKSMIQGCCALIFLFSAVSVWAARSLDGLAGQALQHEQQTQQMREEWSREQQDLLKRIANLRQKSERLKWQSERLDQALVIEEQRIVEQQRRLVETERLRDGLLVWLQGVRQQLAQSVQQGLPFLAGERQQRLVDLTDVLADIQTPLYEQFRRVFEALLVEAEYGYSNEVYRGEIRLDGETVQVDLLRVGLLALLFRVLDRQSVGMYDPATGDFSLLPDENLSSVSRAFTVVRRESVAEMTSLPIGRIVLP